MSTPTSPTPLPIVLPTIAIVLATVLLAASPGVAATFSVGTGCTHGTLAAAILAAFLSPEDDLIKITEDLTNQSVVLDDFRQSVRGTVTIRGGYTSCADTTSSGRSVIDGITSGPIVTVQTTNQTLSTVFLENLELSGAMRGVAVTAGGHLTLRNVLVTDNRDGGALVEGGTLVVNPFSAIDQNGWSGATPIAGGGVQCSGSGQLTIDGSISNNRAVLGAGLALFSSCTAFLGPGTWIVTNFADSNGGGIYQESGTTVVGNGSGTAIAISANHASRGAGLYAAGSALTVLTDVELSDNQAIEDGGAVYATAGATVILSANLGCPAPGWPCNVIGGNLLSDDDGLGSAVYANDASVTIRRFRVSHNQDTFPEFRVPLFFIGGPDGELLLENLTISQNRATNLIEAVDGATVFGGYLSSAGNSYESNGVFPSAITLGGNGTTVGIHSSILWDHQAFFTSGGSPSLDVHCVLTNSLVGIPGGSLGIATQNPGFLAPLSGDLRVGPTSPAVDFCNEATYPDPGAPDIVGNARPLDRPDNPNGSPGLVGGTFDIGAHEVPLVLFADGFESGNTSAWSS